mmetsp:Transcript_60325/g.143818  ORF Transcript_60325/g.143818 Transcript_60325/m.143818 type:complete len:239 (-) Transcript_60325:35-751(-)
MLQRLRASACNQLLLEGLLFGEGLRSSRLLLLHLCLAFSELILKMPQRRLCVRQRLSGLLEFLFGLLHRCCGLCCAFCSGCLHCIHKELGLIFGLFPESFQLVLQLGHRRLERGVLLLQGIRLHVEFCHGLLPITREALLELFQLSAGGLLRRHRLLGMLLFLVSLFPKACQLLLQRRAGGLQGLVLFGHGVCVHEQALHGSIMIQLESLFCLPGGGQVFQGFGFGDLLRLQSRGQLL